MTRYNKVVGQFHPSTQQNKMGKMNYFIFGIISKCLKIPLSSINMGLTNTIEYLSMKYDKISKDLAMIYLVTV